MAKLTAKQANDLANNFLGLAQAIGDFRFEHWNRLSKTENQRLASAHWSILNYGEDILAHSTVLVMDDVKLSLSQINDISVEIKTTISHLNNIQKGISVAASIVVLGAAIVSENPAAIGGAISGVVKAWRA